MQVVTSISKMQGICQAHYRANKTIGFVPTMGYFHEGHLALIKEARKENELVVVSVFVNPLQFGPNEDFDSYPRDADRDERLARELGVDYFFYPSKEGMYPKQLDTVLVCKRRVDVLCGRRRIDHFDGVVTILAKLFNIVFPDAVYMGMKDAQQVAVVAGFVEDYNIPTKIVPVATVRERDGLAMSSRNVYLTAEERGVASGLYESLQEARRLARVGERDPAVVLERARYELLKIEGAEVDYVELYAYPTLEEVEELRGQVLLAVAVKFSQARLIDNVVIKVDK